MKVWVIEKGEYSDRYVAGVVASEEQAQIIKETIEKQTAARGYSIHVSISEFDTDQFITSDNRIQFQVELEWDGKWFATPGFDSWFGEDTTDTFLVMARTPEEAIKIAQDRRAKMLAEREGIT